MVDAGSLTPALRAQLLFREYELLADDPVAGVYVEPRDALHEWAGAIFIRSTKSFYHKGTFRFMITFPEGYPFEPPTCRFVTPMFHPAVDPTTGEADVGMSWYLRLVPFQDNIVHHFLAAIKQLFFNVGARDAPLNSVANSMCGTASFKIKAGECASRSDAITAHTARDFPNALRLSEIPMTAVDEILERLQELEDDDDAQDDDNAAATPAQPAATRTKPTILAWFRKHYLAMSGAVSGIGA